MAGDSLHRQLLDALTTAVLLVDEQLNVRYLNSAAEVLLASSARRLCGQPLNALFQDPEASAEALLDTLNSGNPYTKREATLKVPGNNQVITVDYTVSPIAEAGKRRLVIEIQPLDRLLRISREEALLSASETSRNLVRGMAHEIKNPLGGIRGAAQLLARELPDAGLEEYTRVIIDEADRLRNLVDRMLGPRKPLQRQWLNIHEVLERVASLLSAETGGQLNLMRDYDPSIPELWADKEQLIQAVLNIARNAMQALKAQDQLDHGHIRLRSRTLRHFTIGRRHHRLVIRVDIIDNGPGVPKTIQDAIFYPMISGRAEGTGLGLSIAQSIIGQHHGLIECASQPGDTRFSLYLPLDTEHDDA